VAFSSDATDITRGIPRGSTEIYAYDRRTGKTRLVSSDSNGDPGNGVSDGADVSADGRFVAFDSNARNLVAGDTNRTWDVFVHDMRTGATRRVSVSSSGHEGDRFSGYPSISADGRYVAFTSRATNLVRAKPRTGSNVFVHDATTGKTTQVNVTPNGRPAGGSTDSPSISSSGRYVAFDATSSHLVRVGNGIPSVYVRDLVARKTVLVSVSSSGRSGNNPSFDAAISGDGRHVAFTSRATNLVKRDTNRKRDVFVRDMRRRATKRVSLTAAGRQANGGSQRPSISKHGGFVAYESRSANLVRGREAGRHYFLYSGRGGPLTREADVNAAGRPANRGARHHFVGTDPAPSISPDGRFVVFFTDAANLAPAATGRRLDVYLRGALH
jgi:Tol biopolymer transport system component